jgi:transcriptional regulator with XRE-family HTH domain
MSQDSWIPTTTRMSLARACREGRLALGLSQETVAHKVGVARSYIAAIEVGRANPTLDVVVRLATALGYELDLRLRPPVIIGDRRQRDLVHARCSGHVDRRLRAAGFETAREVPIVDGRWRGWIDLLAFDRRTSTLLIIEIKTVIDDIGAVERQVGWYERVARRLARERGWAPRRVVTWLLVLATEQVETSLIDNREIIDRAFPVRGHVMESLVQNPGSPWPPGRGIACIDPGRHHQRWLIRPRIDGGRTAPRYLDYRDAARSLGAADRR